MKIFHFPRPQRGDTIVEVMIAMTILGLVLGAAFVTSRHSLQSGLQSSYRDQAESYARQQVELIRELDASNQLSGYKDNSFCIDPAGPSKQSVVPATGMCTLPIAGTPGQFSVVDSYSGDCGSAACTKTYSVTVQWPSSNASAPNAVTLYYKPKNSYVPCTSATSCPLVPLTSPPTTPPPGGWPYFSTDMGDNPTVDYGTTLHLIWSTIPPASSCHATGDWGGTQPPSNLVPGYPITVTSTSNYTLTCYDASGTAAPPVSIHVTVNAPVAPFVQTGGPTGQWINQVTFWGNINSHGVPVHYYFSYTDTTTGTSGRAPACVGGGVTCQQPSDPSITSSISTAVSYYLGGMNIGHSYTVQLCAYGPTGVVTCGSTYPFTDAWTVVNMTWAYSAWDGDNGSLWLQGTVNDHNVSGTTAWFEQSCDGTDWTSCNIGDSGSYYTPGVYNCFPSPTAGVPTNNSDNTIYPYQTNPSYSNRCHAWTFFYTGFKNPYYFRICAQNAGGRVCSDRYALWWPSGW